MPRGYELDSYYDSQRAVMRKLYTMQIKRLRGSIEGLKLGYSDAYRFIISSINDGVYQNLGELYTKTFYGTGDKPKIPESALAQDYMSSMELRMNAMAVRRANDMIDKLAGKRFSLKDVQDICYSEAKAVAQEMQALCQGIGEFNMKLESPYISAKPIIKKYDHALKMGTLPKSQTFEHKTISEQSQRDEYLSLMTDYFAIIKNQLIDLGMTSVTLRQSAFARFNGEFYETDMAKSHVLEISKLVLTDNLSKHISIQELQINCDKLRVMKQCLDKLAGKRGIPYYSIYADLEKAGKSARQIVIQKYKTLPELFSGFYHTYTEADRKIVPTR